MCRPLIKRKRDIFLPLLFLTASPVAVRAQGAGREWEALRWKSEQLYFEGKLDSAVIAAEQTVETAERNAGADHPDYALSLGNLAFLYNKTGRYADAEPLYREALLIQGRIPGSRDRAYATTLNSLAGLYHDMERYTEAETLYKEALEIRRETLHPGHPDIGVSINNLAWLYHDLGRYTEAEPLYREAIERQRKSSLNDPDYAAALNNFALLNAAMGRFAEAESFYRRALDIDGKIFSARHPKYATVLNNLAELYRTIGRYAEADTLYKSAMDIDRRAPGLDPLYYATDLHNLALLKVLTGRHEEAESLFKEALEIIRHSQGPDNTSYAASLNGLAVEYLRSRRFADAEPLLKEALEIRRKLLGEEHPTALTSLQNLAELYVRTGKYGEAEPLFREAGRIIETNLRKTFKGLSEKEQQQFLSTIRSGMDAYYAFCLRRSKENPQILGEMYDRCLWMKGYLFNAIRSLRERLANSCDTVLIGLFREWSVAQQMRAAGFAMTAEQQQKTGCDPEIIGNRITAIEKELSGRSEVFKTATDNIPIRWTDVRASLDSGQAAIEIVRVRTDPDRRDETVAYAALKVDGKTAGNPSLILLENGLEMENRGVQAYKEGIGGNRVSMNEAFRTFWSDIDQTLGNATTVYISPDGIYNQINLEALQDEDGRYLGEPLTIQLLSSTKDLPARKDLLPSGERNTAVLIGAPNYDLQREQRKEIGASLRSATRVPHAKPAAERGWKSKKWQPLNGAKRELQVTSALFKENGWTVSSFAGDSALEEVVKSVHRPRVLHLSTHGFFLRDEDIAAVQREGSVFGMQAESYHEAPLLRSGLALTGANDRIEGDTALAAVDDGYLTALEAQLLDLEKTDLVVLSACETGLGIVQAGEGVYGLRRSFQLAGARNVLMSLWKVDDEATMVLMTAFYRHWIGGKNAQEALRKARDELRSIPAFRTPHFWGAFVLFH